MMKRKCKLTFMELLIVMLIIILLITIILPVAVKGREWAKSIACKSNIKSIGTAYLGYGVDFSGIAPQGYGAGLSSWFGGLVISGYLPDEKVNIWNLYPSSRQGTSHIKFSASGSPTVNNAIYPYKPSVYTCPSMPLGETLWRDEYLAGQYGASASSKSFYWTIPTHYTTGKQLVWYSYWHLKVTNTFGANSFGLGLRPQYAVTVIDGTGNGAPFVDNFGCGTLYNNKKVFWGRHFGKPVNVTPAATSGSSYQYYGSGKTNMMMLDGHMESRNSMENWNAPRGW